MNRGAWWLESMGLQRVGHNWVTSHVGINICWRKGREAGLSGYSCGGSVREGELVLEWASRVVLSSGKMPCPLNHHIHNSLTEWCGVQRPESRRADSWKVPIDAHSRKDNKSSSAALKGDLSGAFSLWDFSQTCFSRIQIPKRYIYVCLAVQSGLALCNPCSPPGSFVHGDSPGKNIGVICHALLQRIFPNQESNRGLPHCRQTFFFFYHLNHQGSHQRGRSVYLVIF